MSPTSMESALTAQVITFLKTECASKQSSNNQSTIAPSMVTSMSRENGGATGFQDARDSVENASQDFILTNLTFVLLSQPIATQSMPMENVLNVLPDTRSPPQEPVKKSSLLLQPITVPNTDMLMLKENSTASGFRDARRFVSSVTLDTTLTPNTNAILCQATVLLPIETENVLSVLLVTKQMIRVSAN